MKTSKIFMLFALLSMPAMPAWADTVNGRVASVSSSQLALSVFDANGNPYPNELKLKVDGRTRLDGVASLASLKKWDYVQVNVSQDKGAWRADSVSKFKSNAAIAKQQAATRPPSPNLMDALRSPTGQKVTRGAVTGALTGAVASGTSGGKAGKGALIGAGVGAAAGLLEGLFTQPQQPAQQGSQAAIHTDDAYGQQ